SRRCDRGLGYFFFFAGDSVPCTPFIFRAVFPAQAVEKNAALLNSGTYRDATFIKRTFRKNEWEVQTGQYPPAINKSKAQGGPQPSLNPARSSPLSISSSGTRRVWPISIWAISRNRVRARSRFTVFCEVKTFSGSLGPMPSAAPMRWAYLSTSSHMRVHFSPLGPFLRQSGLRM